MGSLGSIPLQLCEHSAVTFSQALSKTGVTQGQAFAFLVTSPATNFATIGVLNARIGLNATIKLIISFFIFSFVLGFGLDFIDVLNWTEKGGHHDHLPAYVENGSLGICFLLILRWSYRTLLSISEKFQT